MASNITADVEQNINELMNAFGIGSKKEFAEIIGLSKQALNSRIKNNSYPVDKVAEAFPTVRREWLLTGEGEMLRTLSPKTENSEADLSWYRQQIDARTEEMKELKQEIKELKAENRELRLENRELAQKLEEAREGLAIAEAAAKDIGALAQNWLARRKCHQYRLLLKSIQNYFDHYGRGKEEDRDKEGTPEIL